MAGKLQYCAGCRDDFYNHGGRGMDGGGCWNLKDAKVETRYRLAWWTAPTVPNAFQKVTTNSCHHEPGRYAFYKELPSFASCAKTSRKTAAKPKNVKFQPAPIDDTDIPF